MPKRVSKKTKPKTKKTKKSKKFYRKKYKRAFRYHKKSTKKYYKKKYKTSSIYKGKQQVGIKFTRYLDLLQFLYEPWSETIPMLASAANMNDNVIGASTLWKTDFKSQIRIFLNNTFTIYSTDTMHGDGHLKDIPDNINKHVWTAWNPSPQNTNLGMLFDLYINMYKKFKFVGVKVKWIPYNRQGSQLSMPMSTEVRTIGQTVPLPITNTFMAEETANAQAGSSSIFSLRDDVRVAKATSLPFMQTFNDKDGQGQGLIFAENLENWASTLPNFNITPNFRLWINFSKQGYEPLDLPANIIDGAVAADVDTITGTRFNIARIFDQYGHRLDVNNKTVRSYLLNKKFSFFVKPKLARSLDEGPKNSTVMADYEETFRDSEIAVVYPQIQEVSKLVQTGVKMPWLSVFATRPVISLDRNGVNKDAQSPKTKTQALCQIQLHEKYWFDPILFGWHLTCDNMPIDRALPICRIIQQNQHGATSEWYYENYDLRAYDYFHQMGRFKVTYYCKFKGLKNTNFNIPAYGRAQQNAEMEIEGN